MIIPMWVYPQKLGNIYVHQPLSTPQNSPINVQRSKHHPKTSKFADNLHLNDDLGTNGWISPGMLAVAFQKTTSYLHCIHLLPPVHFSSEKKNELPMMVTSLLFLPFHEKPIGKTGYSESKKILWLDRWRRQAIYFTSSFTPLSPAT